MSLRCACSYDFFALTLIFYVVQDERPAKRPRMSLSDVRKAFEADYNLPVKFNEDVEMADADAPSSKKLEKRRSEQKLGREFKAKVSSSFFSSYVCLY